MEPPSKKARTLWEDDSSSDSGDDAGGVSLTKAPEAGFKINEDYARRFEHNKKREEVQKLESKYGKTSSLGKHGADELSDEDSSSDEEEDDDGELATEAVDAEIMATLKAIREKDPRVYDANATFYTEPDEVAEAPKEKKEKPMTLHDYHRENLLKGVDPVEEEQKETVKTFAQEQAELKDALVKEMHAADSDDEMGDAEDDFLVRKAGGADVVPEKEIKLDIENADKDPETFLSNFLSARAWIPEGDRRELHPFDSDDDEELDRADAFEEAYNFRFEDPSKLNEKIMTHARDTTNSLSVRREEKSARKKIRDAERQRKAEEKKERETEKNRLRKLKTEELQKKVSQIKEVAGLRAAEFTDEDWARFLDDAWDDKEWEKEMQKRFGEGYYKEAEEGKKHPKKPTWDDDIDIKDLIPDYEDEEGVKPSLESDGEGEEEEEEAEEEEEEGTSGSKKKSKAELRREQKRDARKERLRIEEAVDRNLDLDITLLPGATKKNATRFRYRETSPQTFGLTARDILMADDSQLNQFAGLKKLASFRDAEKKAKDERKLGKKARLRQWRKETFGNEEGPVFDFGSGKRKADAEADKDGDETKLDIREGDGSGRKKRKRSKKH